jgi:hypothetical protein
LKGLPALGITKGCSHRIAVTALARRSHAEIARIQGALRLLDCRPGPIDGVIGSLTRTAICHVHGTLLRRIGVFYIGPALSVGLLHLRGQTLHEQDFKDENGSERGYGLTVRMPDNAAFLAGGFVVGGEPIPGGQWGVNLHLLPGIWNDFRHLYLDVALVVTVKVWD